LLRRTKITGLLIRTTSLAACVVFVPLNAGERFFSDIKNRMERRETGKKKGELIRFLRVDGSIL